MKKEERMTNKGDGKALRLMQPRDIAILQEIINDLNPQPCPDSISRTDMLDAIGHGTTYTSEELQRIIKGLPSVNPQPKTGYWIDVTNGRGGHECDLCHEYAPSYQSGDEWLTKYCPNCGARMEVENG